MYLEMNLGWVWSTTLTARIGGRSAVQGAAVSGLAACLTTEAHVAVAMSSTVADAILVAIFGTGRTHAHLADAIHGQTLLIDAHALFGALGAIWCQTGIDGLQAKIDNGRTTGDNSPIVTDKGM